MNSFYKLWAHTMFNCINHYYVNEKNHIIKPNCLGNAGWLQQQAIDPTKR